MASLTAFVEMAKLQSDCDPPQPRAIIATASESTMIKNEGGPDVDQAEGGKPVKPNLLTIPPELQIKIFKYLDRASSTCLGLTTKHLYPIHRNLKGKVPLNAWCVLPPNRGTGVHLFALLEQWATPHLVIYEPAMKFVGQQRHWEWSSSQNPDSYEMRRSIMRSREQRKDEYEQGGFYAEGEWIEMPKSPGHYWPSWVKKSLLPCK